MTRWCAGNGSMRYATREAWLRDMTFDELEELREDIVSDERAVDLSMLAAVEAELFEKYVESFGPMPGRDDLP